LLRTPPPARVSMNNQGAMSKEHAALLKEHAQALREHGALMKDHGALVEKSARQVAEAGRVLKERGGKLEAEAARLEAQLQPPQPQAATGFWRMVKPFVNGGASGMLATCVIQPIDMVKVRIQLGEGSAAQVIKNMLANDGLGSFYKGLSAGLCRQAIYTTGRLGSFRVLTNKEVEKNEGKPLPLVQKAFIGLTAGAIGAFVGSPADLALIRMQADSTLPVAQRRHYKNAFHALYRITADEGLLALWKGSGPTMMRAMALNMGMLASYDNSVELFRDKFGAGEVSTVIGASAISGYFACACSLPFDYVKTQIQKMQPDAHGKYPYTGSLDCAVKTFMSGGPFKFYTGFPVYYIRIAPHVMVKRKYLAMIFEVPFLPSLRICYCCRILIPMRNYLQMTWIFLNQIQKFEKKIGI
ncbi:hypothetical protein EJB05_33009, partial [Eragrostis curvula]